MGDKESRGLQMEVFDEVAGFTLKFKKENKKSKPTENAKSKSARTR